MYKLNFKKRVWIVKQVSKGRSYSYVALAQEISKPAVFKIMRQYNAYSWDGLKDHKTGRPETRLSKNAEIIILDLRKIYKYGACHIEQLLKRKGFGISHRQIEKLLLRNGLVEPNIKKQKYLRSERYVRQ